MVSFQGSLCALFYFYRARRFHTYTYSPTGQERAFVRERETNFVIFPVDGYIHYAGETLYIRLCKRILLVLWRDVCFY